jgi:hypothetical protein
MTLPFFKNPYKEKLKDVFTKTFDQIYAEYSKSEKIAYWLIFIAGFSMITYVWIAKLNFYDFLK